MERSKDLCHKFNTFRYLPSKNSFLGLFCTNIHKMLFFAKVLSVCISGICSFKVWGKAPESNSYRETSYFSRFLGNIVTDTVNIGWVHAILTMPTRKKIGIKTIKKKKKETKHFICPEVTLRDCVFSDISTLQHSVVGKGISNDYFEMTQKMFFTTIKSIFTVAVTQGKLRQDNVARHYTMNYYFGCRVHTLA